MRYYCASDKMILGFSAPFNMKKMYVCVKVSMYARVCVYVGVKVSMYICVRARACETKDVVQIGN
jgi:hypothetical protein